MSCRIFSIILAITALGFGSLCLFSKTFAHHIAKALVLFTGKPALYENLGLIQTGLYSFGVLLFGVSGFILLRGRRGALARNRHN